MTVVQKIDRRQAHRYQAGFDIRFSVNGGVEIVSNALNFTSRSLAIRSDVLVQTGDEVAIHFSGLPSIAGEVVRVFAEGFAVLLDEEALALMAHATPRFSESAFHAAGASGPVETITSPFITANSDISARILISSGIGYQPGYNRHFLSILTADADAMENISAIRISSDAVRWMGKALKVDRRDNRSIAVLSLNDWQIHMGAAYGLTIALASQSAKEWALEIGAEPIANHLSSLSPMNMALSA